MTRATIATELGDIEVDLYTQAAPKAAQNFVDLAKKGFYDDVIFHRVIPGFVIQARRRRVRQEVELNAGRVGTGGPGYKFEDEPVHGDYAPGLARDGQRRPEHERQPVLHLRRRPRPAGCRRTTRCSARSRRAWTSSTRSSERRGTAGTCPDSPVAMTKVTIHED